MPDISFEQQSAVDRALACKPHYLGMEVVGQHIHLPATDIMDTIEVQLV